MAHEKFHYSSLDEVAKRAAELNAFIPFRRICPHYTNRFPSAAAARRTVSPFSPWRARTARRTARRAS